MKTQGADAWGGTLAVKLGEDVFMPDVYLLKEENIDRLHEYYLDGPPDLTIEVVAPYMRAFDFGIRLERYAKAGVPEVWMLDFETGLAAMGMNGAGTACRSRRGWRWGRWPLHLKNTSLGAAR